MAAKMARTTLYVSQLLDMLEFNVWCLDIHFRGRPIEWYHCQCCQILNFQDSAKIAGKRGLRAGGGQIYLATLLQDSWCSRFSC